MEDHAWTSSGVSQSPLRLPAPPSWMRSRLLSAGAQGVRARNDLPSRRRQPLQWGHGDTSQGTRCQNPSGRRRRSDTTSNVQCTGGGPQKLAPRAHRPRWRRMRPFTWSAAKRGTTDVFKDAPPCTPSSPVGRLGPGESCPPQSNAMGTNRATDHVLRLRRRRHYSIRVYVSLSCFF